MNDFVYPFCGKCIDNFPMREKRYQVLEDCGNTFYCSEGHALVISRKSITSQMRSAERTSEYRMRTIDRLEKSLQGSRAVLTRQRNRLLRGACPYCNREPKDMIRHIQLHHKIKVRC